MGCIDLDELVSDEMRGRDEGVKRTKGDVGG